MWWHTRRFGLSAKWTSPFKSAGVSVQSTAGSRGVRLSGQQLYRPWSDVECKTSGHPLHSHLSPSLPLPCVTVCRQVLNALYPNTSYNKKQYGRHIFPTRECYSCDLLSQAEMMYDNTPKHCTVSRLHCQTTPWTVKMLILQVTPWKNEVRGTRHTNINIINKKRNI